MYALIMAPTPSPKMMHDRRLNVNSGSDDLALLLHECEYCNLKLEAALSQHTSQDLLYN